MLEGNRKTGYLSDRMMNSIKIWGMKDSISYWEYVSGYQTHKDIKIHRILRIRNQLVPFSTSILAVDTRIKADISDSSFQFQCHELQ